jgi:protein O-mannosyl-transferase
MGVNYRMLAAHMKSLINMTSSYDNTSNNKETFFSIRLELLVCLLLSLSILAVYWQVRNHDFVNLDDNVYVTNNPHVKAGLTQESIAWSFRGVHHGNWHPLTWISHMIDVALYGMNPGQHHLTNVLFHIMNTLLLFLILRRMTNDLWKSGLVAALFAIHPLHVESVAWVSERKDVLCAFFWLLSMWSYFWYTQKPSVSRYMLILLFLIMGIMSKPMIVTLPFALILLDYWPLKRISFSYPKKHAVGFRKSYLPIFSEKIPLLVLVAISCVITFLAEKSGGTISNLDFLPFENRIANALVSYFLYIGKIFWPQGLSVLYPHPGSWPFWQTASTALLLVFITLGVLLNIRKLPYLAVGWMWYLGTLVPVIGLVQIGNQSMADRYTYIPAIGIFIIIVWGGAHLFSGWRCRKWIPATVSIALLSILMTTTWMQIQYWNNGITLFQHTINVTKQNCFAHYALGFELFKRNRHDEAIRQLAKALQLNGSFTPALDVLGSIRFYKGEIDEAIKIYEIISDIEPDNKQAHLTLTKLLDLRKEREFK